MKVQCSYIVQVLILQTQVEAKIKIKHEDYD
jgi:hypothetical protein